MRHIQQSFSKAVSQRKQARALIWRRAAAVAALLGGLLLGGCATGGVPVRDTSRSFKTVVIDAGHGGHDNGTRSRWGGLEKTNALNVAKALDVRLRSAGFRTVMTRQSDRFVELNDRAAISNRQENAIFVSIHFNEARSRRISGAEVHYKSAVSRPLAERILARIDALPGTASRGVKPANFRVLKLNQYPAVLVECGFLSCRSEGSRCATAAYQGQLAGAIADAIIAQRGGSPR